MKAYKGFTKDMKCRDFQYEEGGEYEQSGEIKCCENGFHACEAPLDCFNYYSPADSVYHEVELDGKISPTITGDHNSRITDYTTLVCEQKVYAIGNGQADQTGLHKFSGALNCMHDQQAVVIAIDRAAFNQGENAKYDIGIDKTGIAQTVVAKGPGAICYCIQGNCIDRADTAGCNGKGVKKGESYTLNTIDRHAVCYEESTFYVVRRLTPLECCRLQGMPDWWCKDVPHSDAQEYKMWGNGMALPNALYIMEGF